MVANIEQSVSCPLSKPDARQHSFWGVWCILVCHPHLTIDPLLHSWLGTGMRVGSQNKFCLYRASLVHPASAIVCLSLLACWWCSVTILLFLVHIIRTFATVTTPVLCVLVNT